jgi:hypothetical protein
LRLKFRDQLDLETSTRKVRPATALNISRGVLGRNISRALVRKRRSMLLLALTPIDAPLASNASSEPNFVTLPALAPPPRFLHDRLPP